MRFSTILPLIGALSSLFQQTQGKSPLAAQTVVAQASVAQPVAQPVA